MRQKDDLDIILLISDITLDSVYESLPKNLDDSDRTRIALLASLKVKVELLKDKETLEHIYIERHQWIRMRNRLLVNLTIPFVVLWLVLVFTFYVVFPEKLQEMLFSLSVIPFWVPLILLNLGFIVFTYYKLIRYSKSGDSG